MYWSPTQISSQNTKTNISTKEHLLNVETIIFAKRFLGEKHKRVVFFPPTGEYRDLLFFTFFSQSTNMREILRKCLFYNKERPFLAVMPMPECFKSTKICRRWGCSNRTSSTTPPGTPPGPPGEYPGGGVNPHVTRTFSILMET